MPLSYGFMLGKPTNSAQFSEAVHALTGDGITPQSARFSASINGFTVTLASGYALASGRWVKSDEPVALSIGIPGNTDDRTDLVAVQVDLQARNATLAVIPDVNSAAIQKDPSILHTKDFYRVPLYLIRVRRGATSLNLDDVTDLRADNKFCGDLMSLSEVSGDVLYVYQFLTSGIDQEIARLIGLSNQVIDKGSSAVAALDAAIRNAGGTALGELMISASPPTPEIEWLLCDGKSIPEQYAELSLLLDGTLPNIMQHDGRFQTWIYAGAPSTQ